MIALQSDCLIFQLTNGESVPCSPEMISVEIVGDSDGNLDPEMLHHAAASVFHYFKKELERETVTVGEFASALEKVLRRLGLTMHADGFAAAHAGDDRDRPGPVRARIRRQPGTFFLPAPARRIADAAPPVAAHGALSRAARLRQATAGAQRWSARCEKMQEQIIEYLRECLTAEPDQKGCALVVE